MRFKAPPNHTVRISTPIIQRALGRKFIFFDENGEYETDKPIAIKILNQICERQGSVISISHEIENNAAADTGEEIKTYHCKHCDATYENWGDLMAHYRAEHPKSKGDK